MKPKHMICQKDDKNCELAEEVIKEIFEETNKRRILVRKPSGEIALELPLTVSVGILGVVLIFFFPVLIIAVIGGYFAKLRFEVIRDISEEEAQIFDRLEQHNTILGVQYEVGDGQVTVLQ